MALGGTWVLGATPLALTLVTALAVVGGTLLAGLATWVVVTALTREPITTTLAEGG